MSDISILGKQTIFRCQVHIVFITLQIETTSEKPFLVQEMLKTTGVGVCT